MNTVMGERSVRRARTGIRSQKAATYFRAFRLGAIGADVGQEASLCDGALIRDVVANGLRERGSRKSDERGEEGEAHRCRSVYTETGDTEEREGMAILTTGERTLGVQSLRRRWAGYIPLWLAASWTDRLADPSSDACNDDCRGRHVHHKRGTGQEVSMEVEMFDDVHHDPMWAHIVTRVIPTGAAWP